MGGQSLRNELLLFSDHNADDNEQGEFTLSPFMQSLCSNDQITLMEEYIWIIHGDQFQELERAKGEYRIWSETYYYHLPNTKRVSFKFSMTRKSGNTKFAGFGVQIEGTPYSVDG